MSMLFDAIVKTLLTIISVFFSLELVPFDPYHNFSTQMLHQNSMLGWHKDQDVCDMSDCCNDALCAVTFFGYVWHFQAFPLGYF